jgi:hypothetical protein
MTLVRLRRKQKPSQMVHAYNPSTQEIKAGKLRVPGQSGLHKEFRATWNDIARTCLKKRKQETKILNMRNTKLRCPGS